MTKFADRIIGAIGQNITLDQVADQCEINTISYEKGQPVKTASLIKCDLEFVEFRVMPSSMLRCFCGKKIDYCFVINHIETGKQFALGRNCLYSLFGDRLAFSCKKCFQVSRKENRVGPDKLCKQCSSGDKTQGSLGSRFIDVEEPAEPFEIKGSDKETYIENKKMLASRLARFEIHFGRHKGDSFGYVFEKHRKYCDWVIANMHPESKFCEYIDLMSGLELDEGLIKIPFGKYKGKTVQEVSIINKRYLMWFNTLDFENWPRLRECLDKFLE